MGELQEGSGVATGCGCIAAGGRVYDLLKMTASEDKLGGFRSGHVKFKEQWDSEQNRQVGSCLKGQFGWETIIC